MKNTLIIVFSFFSLNIFCQTSSWKELCKLDQRMNHSSGILSLNNGETFWTQVDNSSPAEIYEIDKECKVLRTLIISNAPKTDWEDIAHDDKGNIYIGDFGNNNNKRTNLKIYILKNVDQHIGDTIMAEKISFQYANQHQFPPAAELLNFDMEAIVWYHDSLHLFSKNRTDPFTGYTYQYSFPDIPGDYSLIPVDSFKTGDGPMIFFWITGAAINRLGKEFVLLAHDRIWMFKNFTSSLFFQGNVEQITLPTYTQKEGISYAKENTWYLTDEYFPTLGLGGNLYEMKLEAISGSEETNQPAFEVYPNPVSDFLHIFKNDDHEESVLGIYDFMGNLCKKYTIHQLKTIIPIEDLVNGIYTLKTTSKKLKKYFNRKIVILKK